jgi:hypothetical protein
VRYFHYRLSEGVWATNPYDAVAALGSLLNPNWAVADDGYRIAYVTGDCDPDDLDPMWDVTEVTEAQALTFCQAIWEDAEVLPDGRISGPPPEDIE